MMRRTILLLGMLCWGGVVLAQRREEWKIAKGLFAGEWVEKKSGRHLRVVFVEEWRLAEIIDWHGNYYVDHAMIDMYQASVQKNKLVMAEHKTEHRAPYAELVKRGERLVTGGMLLGKPKDDLWIQRCSYNRSNVVNYLPNRRSS